MANFKSCIRKARKDGFCVVYIRVTHRRQIGYIKTNKMVAVKDLSKDYEINDPYVVRYCADLIIRFNEFLNQYETSNWTIDQVISVLKDLNQDVCFSDYAKTYINHMINEDRDSTAKNYKAAVSSIHKFFRSNKVMFSQFTSLNIDKWIKSLSSMKRAKEMYPVCIRMIYKSAVREYNDYDNGIIRIKVNPWVKVDIPKGDTPEKRAITADECRAFFAADCKDNGYINSRFELGHDVAMLVFCLAGINTADLYRLKKSNYHNGIICYNRSKTLKYRSDNAYFEIKAERIILPIIDKYLAGKDDPFLFVFHKLYANLDSFNSAVNSGIGKICDSIGIPNQLRYSVYTFRHTWATIAQNDCGASIPEVGFAMNHSQRSTRITKSYIKIDFSPAWRLNAKVIEFIFFSSKKGKLAESTSEKKEDKIFRISMKAMIYGCAYFCGNLLAEVSDVGYNNIDDVIKKLAQKLPKRLPNMSKIQVRIKNVDNDTEVVYEKTKGKDF